MSIHLVSQVGTPITVTTEVEEDEEEEAVEVDMANRAEVEEDGAVVVVGTEVVITMGVVAEGGEPGEVAGMIRPRRHNLGIRSRDRKKKQKEVAKAFVRG